MLNQITSLRTAWRKVFADGVGQQRIPSIQGDDVPQRLEADMSAFHFRDY